MGDEAPLIVGVCLASDTDPAHSHTLATITIPPSHLPHPLSELRPLVASSLPPSLYGKPFLFLTSHGWEVAETMETVARIQQVFQSHTHSVSIRLSRSQPRLGLVAEGTPPVPLGFIFCDVGDSLARLHREIARQLPPLHKALVATGYSLLDCNGWPVAREQEQLFTIAEVATGRTVRLRVYPQQRRPSESLVALPSLAETTALSLPSFPNSSLPPSFSSTGAMPSDPAHSLRRLRPLVEESADMAESSVLEQSLSADAFDSAMAPNAAPGTTPYEILLSYVHREASDEAVSLREALQVAGYRVFLDVECIRSGSDWQDVLNDAVSNCTVFIPLITCQYGQTLWTNREVKLADVLGKVIIPVNFLQGWPPKCLAIQFAATQYISWPHSSTDEEWNEDTVTKVAGHIVRQYKTETGAEGGAGEEREEGGVIMAEGGEDEEGEEMETSVEDRRSSFARTNTQIIVEEEEDEGKRERGEESVVKSASLVIPQLARNHRRSTIKSYASTLPSSIPVQYRKSIQSSRTGKPLVVISCHTAQKEFSHELAREMEGRGYEAWCSCDILHLGDEEASPIFQLRANEAGVVIFVFSKEFMECSFCEKQVYYCEQRKTMIPVVYKPIQLPDWVCLLIGTSPFVSCQSSNYRQTLIDRVEEAINPQKREVSLKAMLKEKAEVARLCAEVTNKLPKGRRFVYISGGTKFFSSNGEEICRQLGRQLAQDSNIALVTGGFFGVGETMGRSFHEERMRCGQPSGVWHLIAERDDQDKSSQTRQNSDGSFPALPYGETLFAGSSVRQREVITPHVVKTCVLVEGGPGAAFEAQQFFWNGNYVIPVRVTGGAAMGLFNVPQAIFQRPPAIDASDWSVLGNKEATPTQVAAAIVRIIRTLNFDEKGVGPRTPGIRRRKLAEARGSIQRSETLPQGVEYPPEPMKRTYSDSQSPTIPCKLRASSRAISQST